MDLKRGKNANIKDGTPRNDSANFSLSPFVGVNVMLAVLDKETVLEELCRTSSTTGLSITKDSL
jgi:hypothetical protein